jgi:hypothetical protein
MALEADFRDNSEMADDKPANDGFNRFEVLHQLSHAEMAVFFELNRRCARDNSCFLPFGVNILELSRESAVSPKSVYNALSGLADKGLVCRDPSTGEITLLMGLDLHLRDSEKY